MARVREEQESRSPRWSKKTVKELSDRLKLIRKQNGGILTSAMVVKDAKDPKSPLHRHFDWDVQSAAEKYWLQQAGVIIRCVMVSVEVNGQDIATRAWVSVRQSEQREYMPLAEVEQNPALRSQVLLDARESLVGWLNRYETYKELFGAVSSVRKAVDEIQIDE